MDDRKRRTPGRQAQADVAEFKLTFVDEPDVVRKVWLFSLLPGHSRFFWWRFCASQELQTVPRRHIAAFASIGGAAAEAPHDRIKTAAIGEDEAGAGACNSSLVAMLGHYGSAHRACRAQRAKTKGKEERPFRHARRNCFLARTWCRINSNQSLFSAVSRLARQQAAAIPPERRPGHA